MTFDELETKLRFEIGRRRFKPAPARQEVTRALYVVTVALHGFPAGSGVSDVYAYFTKSELAYEGARAEAWVNEKLAMLKEDVTGQANASRLRRFQSKKKET